MRLLLILVTIFAIAISEARQIGSHERDGKQEEQPCSLRDPIMSPIHEVRYGRDVIYQFLPNPINGVLFLAHSDGDDPLGFFDQGPNCEECLGLPEHRSIALEALKRGYAVIAAKSVDSSFDEESLDKSQDLGYVISIIDDIRRENSVDSSVPLVVLGISSGGFFSTNLATTIPTAALVLMISQGKPEVMMNATSENFPPTFFVYMNTTITEDDSSTGTPHLTTAAQVEESMAILGERGVLVGAKLCLPKPVGPLFFTERLLCTSEEMSANLQRAYKAANWLDDDDYVIVNPLFSDWLAPLPKSSWPYWYVPGAECKVDALCEELRRAEGVHVTTGDGNQEMFSWLDSILSLPSDDDQLLLSDSR